MVQHKTAGLFRLGITLLQVRARAGFRVAHQFSPTPQSFSGDARDFIPLCNDLGLYYQVMDDVLNLKSAEMFGHKSFCEDLTEGKFSFPIVHHVLASPGDTRVLNIMRKKTTDVALKQFAVRCLEETDSFSYALQFSEAVAERIRKQCEPDAVPAVPFCNVLLQAPNSVATPCFLQCCSIGKSACVQPACQSSRRLSLADAAAFGAHLTPFCPCGCKGGANSFSVFIGESIAFYGALRAGGNLQHSRCCTQP